ncbi:hypothetical protein [Streptomyces sp. NPDC086010]|uniref:hypothetical protein n=1 Tax=Streptomyces sp. NPDC086010 TaxID=3365745 RepID=UPI0037CD671B
MRHQVNLSTVGVDLLPENGYYRAAKVAQEEVVRDSSLPYTIVRAAQLEFIVPVMAMSTQDGHERLPSTQLRPSASAAVAAAAQGEPLRGVRSVAGPDIQRLDRLGEVTLAPEPAGRSVVTDETAGLFRRRSRRGSHRRRRRGHRAHPLRGLAQAALIPGGAAPSRGGPPGECR